MISLRKMSKIPIDGTWNEINTTLPSYNGVEKPFNSGLSTPSGKILATYNRAGAVNVGIYCSVDKGTTWSSIQQGAWTLAGITTTGKIIAFGRTDQDYSAIIYSNDDGETWTVKPMLINGSYVTSQYSVLSSLKISDNTLYVSSFNNSNNTSTIYKSVDYGETWSAILSGNNLISFCVKHVNDATKVSYLQAQSAYSTDIIIRFSGTGNAILYDVHTQTEHNSDTIENAGSIYLTNTDRLIAVTHSSSHDAVIYYSDDFGYTWIKAKQIGASLSYLFVDPNPIYTLCVLDNAQLLVGTEFGLLKSSDNGTTWSLSSTFRNVPGPFIWLPNDNTVIILGYQKDHTGSSAVNAIGNDLGKLYYSGGIIPAKNAFEKYLDQNGVQEIVTQYKAYCDSLVGGA